MCFTRTFRDDCNKGTIVNSERSVDFKTVVINGAVEQHLRLLQYDTNYRKEFLVRS
jgi:hypothetical protein